MFGKDSLGRALSVSLNQTNKLFIKLNIAMINSALKIIIIIIIINK